MIKNYKFLILCFVFILMVSFGLKATFAQAEQQIKYNIVCQTK